MANPLDTINRLTEAINRGDLNSALSLYESDAALVAEPSKIARGRDAIRSALQEFISLKPVLKSESHQIVDVGNLVLYYSKWNLIGTDRDGNKVEMKGTSSDVLRLQADGRWLVAIDNPWGASIVS